jgi:hypothetical protein
MILVGRKVQVMFVRRRYRRSLTCNGSNTSGFNGEDLVVRCYSCGYT